MLIAIAADLHDNRDNWRKLNDYMVKQGIVTLLFCGDLAGAEILQKIRTEFQGEIHMIAGNAETYDTSALSSEGTFHFYGRYGRVTIADKQIGLIHEPAYKKELQAGGKLDYIFYGHTHKPWIANEDGVFVANPGTLGGVGYQATFAILDTTTGGLQLIILDAI